VKPYANYAEDRGETLTVLSGGRTPMAPATGGASSLMGIDPEIVGPMVVEAIINDRPVCMTHPVPLEAIQEKVDEWLGGHPRSDSEKSSHV